jgi:gamma-glutamyltranspeptidase
MMNGIGGELFAIVYEAKTGKLYVLNASGWAPAKLTIETLNASGVQHRQKASRTEMMCTAARKIGTRR